MTDLAEIPGHRYVFVAAVCMLLVHCNGVRRSEKNAGVMRIECHPDGVAAGPPPDLATVCSAADRKNAGAVGPFVENEGSWYQGQQWFHYRQGCRSFEARPSNDVSELIIEEFESGRPRSVPREIARLPLEHRSVTFPPGTGVSATNGLQFSAPQAAIRLSATEVLLPLCGVFGSYSPPSYQIDFVGRQFVVIDHGSDPPAVQYVGGTGVAFEGSCVSAVGVRDGADSAILAIQVHPDTVSATEAPPIGETLERIHVEIVRVVRASGGEFVASRVSTLPPAWKDVRALARRGKQTLLVGYRNETHEATVVGEDTNFLPLKLQFGALEPSGTMVEVPPETEEAWNVRALLHCTSPGWVCGHEVVPMLAGGGSELFKGDLRLNVRNELRIHASSEQGASAEDGQINQGHVGFLTKADEQFPQGFHSWDASNPPVAMADPGNLDAWLEPGCSRTISYLFQPVTLPSGELLLFAVMRCKPESCSGVFAIRMTHHGSIRWLKRLPLSTSVTWDEIRYVPEVDASGFVWWGPTSFLAPFAVTDPVDISACGGLGWDGCSDGNACTMDDCAATTGCTHRPVPDGVPCVDGVPSACVCGVCVVGKSP